MSAAYDFDLYATGPTRAVLDADRMAYAKRKRAQGFPMSAIARMVGVCESDLRERLAPTVFVPTVADLVERVIGEVAEARKVNAARIKNTFERTAPVTQARHEVMWRLRQLTSVDGLPRFTYGEIARRMGFTTDTAARAGIMSHERRLAAQ